MNIPIYQVDAFTQRVFSGNPAAVCPLESWPDDAVMQSIALENNLSETAFFIHPKSGYHIRWFTPLAEVDLCGHATLATAFVIFTYFEKSSDELHFSSRSGELIVKRNSDLFTLHFPAKPPMTCAPPKALLEGLVVEPIEVMRADDYFVVYSNEEQIIRLNPLMEKLKELDLRGVVVTAKGREVDFVSRFFAPILGVDEDPVTGSAHCSLVPYWSKKLGKNKLHARQLSRRGGELYCQNAGERVLISGHAVEYMQGRISIPV